MKNEDLIMGKLSGTIHIDDPEGLADAMPDLLCAGLVKFIHLHSQGKVCSLIFVSKCEITSTKWIVEPDTRYSISVWDDSPLLKLIQEEYE